MVFVRTSCGSMSILAAVAAASFLGCSDAKQNQKAPAAVKSGTATDANPGGEEGGGEEGGEGGEGTGGDAGTVDKNAGEVFTVWCKAAGETPVAKEQLKDYYDRFCTGGKPTKLLTSSLLKSAYAGSGNPSLKKIEEWVEDKAAKPATTAGFVGIGIKLPISVQEHFDQVGPRGGDVDSLKELASAGGAEGSAEVLETYKKGDQGKYYIRGWKIHQTASKGVEGLPIKVTTETEARTDQWELKKGEAYMYTSYVTKSISLVKGFDMFTAGVQVGDDAYLLTIARIVVENKGFHAKAMDEIKKTALTIIKAMYVAAEAAK